MATFAEPETLSTRSYLELARDLPLAEEGSDPSTRASTMSERYGRSNSGSQQPDTSEMASKMTYPPSPDRPIRKRGRPKLEKAKDAAAIEERRLQIRRAQRTYRQKKETTITSLRTRVETLEQTLHDVSAILGPVGDPVAAIDNARRLIQAGIDQTRLDSGANPSICETSDKLRDVFGYRVSRDAENSTLDVRHISHTSPAQPRAPSPSPLLDRLFPSTTIYTYSYQESDLSRRLQRFCLEHTYRWLSDAHSDPGLLSRVFGLVPCIHDMPGVRRAFRRVLQSEIGSPLEGNKLPFYTLGGAGRHFPRRNAAREPVLPENTRRPGKILRRLARILRRGGIQDWDEDWSADAEPEPRDWREAQVRRMSHEDRLRALQLDGEWFDCHDVQGYLEQRGIVTRGSSLWLDVPPTTMRNIHVPSPDRSASHWYTSREDVSASEMSLSPSSTQSGYVLDVENFFEILLAHHRILGRAPGFRLVDVDAALRTAIHRPFT
ncbi:hypothetical protein N7492_005100 [Penicillium capsulatum]|uniref:BZIP domain-containing protein n=1 Tax=Penicillium capsulatum TaxID=69766 RepID=A0A9W9ICT4_9EURO|nr:hypothetical protein N7492_005100 [Penicillium capsulatum]KAJ6135793.1 hypothetical protein N7512_000953 [Penicillium capsulatum]